MGNSVTEARKLAVGAVHCPFYDNDGACEHGPDCLLQHVGAVSKGNWTLLGEMAAHPDLCAYIRSTSLTDQLPRVRARPELPG